MYQIKGNNYKRGQQIINPCLDVRCLIRSMQKQRTKKGDDIGHVTTEFWKGCPCSNNEDWPQLFRLASLLVTGQIDLESFHIKKNMYYGL